MARRSETCAIRCTTKHSPPQLPLVHIKNSVLEKTYELSVAFVGDRRSRTLNLRYRNKDTPTNVLTFPLSPKSGEIIIALPQARREAKRFDMTYRTYVGYLFIHGLLHLKGLRHGGRMDREEKRLLNRFFSII